jgi:hypothetical protein
MKIVSAALLGLTILCTACGDTRFVGRSRQTEFDKEVTCSQAAAQILKVRGSWYTGEGSYIDQSFYSPKRNSCVAVLVLTTGEVTHVPDDLSDTYDIVDTLTYQVIRHVSSGTGPDRTKTSEEIDKAVDELKQ